MGISGTDSQLCCIVPVEAPSFPLLSILFDHTGLISYSDVLVRLLSPPTQCPSGVTSTSTQMQKRAERTLEFHPTARSMLNTT